MVKGFRHYDMDQQLLLPQDMREWLRADHLALYVSDVVEELDLGGIMRAYEGEMRGRPPYHPAMMVKLLVYGYCTGRTSSRKIERAKDVAFRVLACASQPDHARHCGISEAASEGVGEAVCAGAAVMSASGAGEIGARGDRRDEDEGERIEAEIADLRGREQGREGVGGASQCPAGRSRADGRA